MVCNQHIPIFRIVRKKLGAQNYTATVEFTIDYHELQAYLAKTMHSNLHIHSRWEANV
jgi:hypothetical protein